MRPVLLTYFDVGESYGIGDEAFTSNLARETNSLAVGILNPLGRGVRFDLSPTDPVVTKWREIAEAMVDYDEMEFDWSADWGISHDDFKLELKRLIKEHPITECNLNLFAVGTVLVWLQFGRDLPVNYMADVLYCYEFAVYTQTVSLPLKDSVKLWVKTKELVDKGRNPIKKLSSRPEPKVIPSSKKSYHDIDMIKSCTTLFLGIDRGDDDSVLLSKTCKAAGLSDTEKDTVDFEYHGQLHFGWSGCVVMAKDLEGKAAAPAGKKKETPEEQILRMLECIRISHACLGACEAFEQLMLSKISDQVGSYVEQPQKRNDAADLNRLRTLVLAVVNLTGFIHVAPCEEDQSYFKLFETHARTVERNKAIRDGCDLLYSVQCADTEAAEAANEKRLGNLLALLAGLTVISVFSDSYNFLQTVSEKPLIPGLLSRALLLLTLVLCMSIVILRPARSHCSRSK